MARRAKAAPKAYERTWIPSWATEYVWGEISPGDPVWVSGESTNGEKNPVSFVFRSVHVKDGEVIAVHCHGGTKGDTTNRFFAPNRVTKIVPKVKRTRKTKVTVAA